MPELLDLELPDGHAPQHHDSLRKLSRSPHPYHRRSFELEFASHRIPPRDTAAPEQDAVQHHKPSTTSYPLFSKESSPGSESGTEADDEHFLKGLPAPKVRLHKGLRGRNELLSGTTTPLLSPALLGAEDRQIGLKKHLAERTPSKRPLLSVLVRHRVLVHRATETGIVLAIGCMIGTNRQVAPILGEWSKEYQLVGLLYGGLIALWPLRLSAWTYLNQQPSPWASLHSSTFDPAPLLYPPTVPLFVSLLVSANNQAALLPNIVLSISSIPQQLIPRLDASSPYDTFHWLLSCLPLLWQPQSASTNSIVSNETLVLLYPLHQALCSMLHHLTTTSLLTAELQLLSIALINLLILATSPQAQILKGLLWGGGLGVLILCDAVIRWEIALARVPKWRFRRIEQPMPSPWKRLGKLLSWHRIKYELLGPVSESNACDTPDSSDAEEESPIFNSSSRVHTMGPSMGLPTDADSPPSSPTFGANSLARSHTLSSLDKTPKRNNTHTPSGRRKRATSMSVRPFLKLTQGQATVRRWLYAGYVYLAILGIIFAGIRPYIGRFALGGHEPLGWALGYAFGGVPWFRFQVVNANLERWVCLPPRRDDPSDKQCSSGWVQHIRHDDFGEANTRLLLFGYWICVLIFGLIVVLRLQGTYEVDTRRKVFHFMMVAMLLPSTFIDPTYAALSLSLVLTVFLILDLIRASQLPPLSKPIASFLAPYLDGRDFRGPVVISHIFLLIGCALPLWLTLASLPRTGSDYLTGWEIPTREISMVSGVICVGLGDAAASLIGRRYGHRKWLWGGGKSLEGSAAFATAVFAGLIASSAWLRIGRWPVTDGEASILTSVRNAGVCGSIASLTEAVLTGGNDNVIVPVVLWTCVKSLVI